MHGGHVSYVSVMDEPRRVNRLEVGPSHAPFERQTKTANVKHPELSTSCRLSLPPVPYHTHSLYPKNRTQKHKIRRQMHALNVCSTAIIVVLYLWHGEVVHEDGHLLASRGAEVLAPALVQLHLDGVLTHERRRRARKVYPGFGSWCWCWCYFTSNIGEVPGGEVRSLLAIDL